MDRTVDTQAFVKATSFADSVDTASPPTVVGDVHGSRLRVRRLVQGTDGLSPEVVGNDHTLVFHFGGEADVRRYAAGKLSGITERLRTTTLVPAFIPTQWDLPDGTDVMHVYLEDALFRSLVEREGHDPDSIEMIDRMGKDDPFVADLAPILLREMRSPEPHSKLMIDGFDAVIAAHLLRNYSNLGETQRAKGVGWTEGDERRAVGRMQAIMLERLDENVSMAELSDAVGLPPFVLLRRFKKIVGMTPHVWLTQSRVERVRELLCNTRRPLGEIALDCGFSSQSHMTTVFGREASETPGAYRKKHGRLHA